MSAAPRPMPARATAGIAGALAALGLAGGLIGPGAYTLSAVVLHLAVIALAVLGIAWSLLTAPTEPRLATPVLTAATALLVAAELPWSLAGLGGRPWFELVGLAAGLVAAVAATRLVHAQITSETAGPDGAPVERRSPVAAPALDIEIRRKTPAMRASVAPGWYADPVGKGWRWWDGARWTEHRTQADA